MSYFRQITTALLANDAVTGVKILDGTITDADIAAANKDGTAGTPSLRTLGFTAVKSMPGNATLDQITPAAANVDLNNFKIVNLAAPTTGLDAANKDYVDTFAQGLAVHSPARAATTANITLSGLQTIDGVSLSVGDRVLVKNQTTGSQNGIYVVSAGAWTRATDADTSAEVVSGLFLWVLEGTVNGDNAFVLTTNNPITLGTTSLTFQQFNGAGQIVAGTGLTKTGNTLSLTPAGTGGASLANDVVGQWTTVARCSSYLDDNHTTAGSRLFVDSGTLMATLAGTANQYAAIFPFSWPEFVMAGRTSQMRLVVSYMSNSTDACTGGNSIDINAAIVTGVSGAADQLGVTSVSNFLTVSFGAASVQTNTIDFRLSSSLNGPQIYNGLLVFTAVHTAGIPSGAVIKFGVELQHRYV